ncbi:uncharacterized protein [Amphiura filiformis]|uniref:uncharacterized protein n=1 Tax=Amphiura filiformis TaxID=82378 RepID=UPI003B216D3A
MCAKLIMISILAAISYRPTVAPCVVGQEPEQNNDCKIRWMLPRSQADPCSCTRFIYGGLNASPVEESTEPYYFDSPKIFRNEFGCSDDQETTDDISTASSGTIESLTSTQHTRDDMDSTAATLTTATIPHTASLGSWNTWSECNKQCGPGTMTRTRVCQMPGSATCSSETIECILRDWCLLNGRCGPDNLAANNQPAKCLGQCCSSFGWCGQQSKHCSHQDHRCCTGLTCNQCSTG